jgi:hypothetical protein
VPEPIFVDAALAELSRAERASATGPDGFSAEELGRKLGITHRAAADKIRNWVYEERLEFAGFRKSANVVGRFSTIPVYRLRKGAA